MPVSLLYREAMLALRPALARAAAAGRLSAMTPARPADPPDRPPEAPAPRGSRSRRPRATRAPEPVPVPADGPFWEDSGAPGALPALPPSPRRKVLRALAWTGRAILHAHLAFIATTSLLVAIYAFVDPPVTVLALSRKYLDGWTITRPRPVTLAQVPKTTRRMLVSIEDGKFWNHAGFDPEGIRRALAINKDLGIPLAGGSTLTMQTARTLFLTPVKSYFRKYLEAIVTLELELILSKERILELYFSWAEWGKGIFGIEAASRAYYKKGVASLGLDESARVLAILSSPIRYSPFTLAKRGQLRQRYEYLIKKYGG